MYQAPDFVKVNVKAKDVFATYTNPCIFVSQGTWLHTGDPCTEPVYSPGYNLLELYPTAQWQCYINQNAPT